MKCVERVFLLVSHSVPYPGRVFDEIESKEKKFPTKIDPETHINIINDYFTVLKIEEDFLVSDLDFDMFSLNHQND